ncbi:M20/M25/M40 family metallo-hydrolase [Salinimonas sediminis]|uniref:M20/M25/M40 family metallo-hydrolase n=1 Tax=Salinimonas sediminis TaxID=2303538 RepID=A0A346NRQ8_9ALTE|nr:M20/M25/M40 family metallo-hydrolase [Salinimonas sediminis]AXR08215.1 M20/M25/M40 family metallo-hydrolase [Salinimonas sediminis]
MKKFGTGIVLGFIGLLLIMLIRTFLFTPEATDTVTTRQVSVPELPQVLAHLSEAIQIKTLSTEEPDSQTRAAFTAFGKWLQSSYPLVHQHAQLTRLNEFTLLYRWPGSDKSAQPVLLSAHYDVVPVNPDTLSQWQYPPFAGTVTEQAVWGRGALDDKGSVVALMESVEHAIKNHSTPGADVYIALTHDEEVGGERGANAVTDYFRQKQIKLAWSLDEGSFVLAGLVPGIDKPVASINVAEKGFLTLELVAKGEGGHSSMPPSETAVTRLAQAIINVQQAPVPGALEGVTATMYSNIAQHMDFSKRFLFANTWLFKPVIEHVVSNGASGNAMLRTTTAATMLKGSIKANVLPDTATAKINFRLHPRDSVDSVVRWVTQAVNDELITINIEEAFEPSTIAKADGPGFTALQNATAQVFPRAIITPGLTIAATDSHYYSTITQSYRFTPMVITPEDLAGFHGMDEHVSHQNMRSAVTFYSHLLQQL